MAFIISIIVGVISFIVGFFIGKGNLAKKVHELTESNEDLKYKLDMLTAKNKTLMATLNNQQNKKGTHQKSLNPLEFSQKLKVKDLVQTDGDEIKRLYGKAVEINDFKIIEGIGPKLEKLLNQSEIKTWIDIANSSADTLSNFLSNYGNRYTLHDPTTWPKQAELAASGKWSELKNYQAKLHKGKEKS
jgi:predicted flap endonuclease-1-like 5' DNA nuclease